ncbi:MAG TPA: ATP synthase F1 subunit gamma [Candidatus Saccharimonadales bacterium]|nr:ATP synthase F1 subunit gamma [Candidatus Saccharimonadales bacterium]
MASTITLRRRIRSIKNTRQITQAQQLVAASKLRRAQEYAARSRDYAELANELLTRLSGLNEVAQQPLFEQRPVKNRLYILVTSNTGLAGAYNANVIKLLTHAVAEDRQAGIVSHVIAIGNKGAQFVRRVHGIDLHASYPGFGNEPTANDLRPVLNTIVEEYRNDEVDEVRVLYTKFVSTVSQRAESLQLLPAQTPDRAEAPAHAISNFEPDVETVIDQVATRLIEAQVWQALLESIASEHAMRMVAMKNATDNAKDLIDDYTLELNTARQAAITQELAEITGGAEAMNG